MKVSYGLPAHRVDAPGLLSGSALGTLAAGAEAAGFDAVYVTEHPFPADDWLAGGGHHALDPGVALAVAAGATTRVRLHTNLFVPAYRNPFLAAKAVSSLDVVSDGRVILGVGAGYLEGEFAALGADFEHRNDRLDQALAAMAAAWAGTSVSAEGPGWRATGNTMLPRPVQRPHPPIWVGGNSRRALRRAVELGDGWSPFPAGAGGASVTRTRSLTSAAQLRARLDEGAGLAAAAGRTAPLDVCFVPRGLGMAAGGAWSAEQVVASCAELAEAGVTWVTVALPGDTVEAQLDAIGAFGEAVLPAVHPLAPGFHMVAPPA
jgi:probable F420-dependent oxidoreductase